MPTGAHAGRRDRLHGSPRESPSAGHRHRIHTFVGAVVAAGAGVLLYALLALRHAAFSPYALILGLVTIASGHLAIKMPGRQARVSVSEVFVFIAVLLFGPAPATLIVAADGLWISCRHRDRRLYRTLFNIAEPAITVWTAGQVFFLIMAPDAVTLGPRHTPLLAVATLGMTATFFALNSGLTALALGLESHTSPLDVWRRHARHLAINYYAAGSLATLTVASSPGFNFEVASLALPLVGLSYVAYQEAARRSEQAEQHVGEVEHLYHATVEMLAIAVDAKDRVTHGHIRRVQRHTMAIAQALGLTDHLEARAIEAGSLLHDIGKLVVPDSVLNKPGALTPAEFEIIKRHAHAGATILESVSFPYPVVPIVRHHHEQWNGGGYPDGLSGPTIPLGARILAVVDCFDALTSDRPYRPRMSDEQAIAIIQSRSGTFYDPVVVAKMIEMIPHLREEDAQTDTRAVALGVGPLDQHSASHASAPENSDQMRAIRYLRLAGKMIDQELAALSCETCVFSVDTVGNQLLVAHAAPRLQIPFRHLRLELGSGVSGWVASNRIMIRNSDPTLELGELAHTLGLRFCVSVPLIALGDLTGVLTVYRTQATPFAEEDVRHVARVAQLAGLHLSDMDTAPSRSTPESPRHRAAVMA